MQKKSTVTDILVANLAFADFLFTAFCSGSNSKIYLLIDLDVTIALLSTKAKFILTVAHFHAFLSLIGCLCK